jgi:hypothetical protein
MLTRGNPFVTVTKHTVIKWFRAIGSRDPDVLLARKAVMLRSLRHHQFLGIGLVLVGLVLTRLSPGFAAGVPVLMVGAWLWWRGTRNVAAVEAGYTEFVKSPTT